MGDREDLTTAVGQVAGPRAAVAALGDSVGETVAVQRLREDELGPHADLGRG